METVINIVNFFVYVGVIYQVVIAACYLASYRFQCLEVIQHVAGVQIAMNESMRWDLALALNVALIAAWTVSTGDDLLMLATVLHYGIIAAITFHYRAANPAEV